MPEFDYNDPVIFGSQLADAYLSKIQVVLSEWVDNTVFDVSVQLFRREQEDD